MSSLYVLKDVFEISLDMLRPNVGISWDPWQPWLLQRDGLTPRRDFFDAWPLWPRSVLCLPGTTHGGKLQDRQARNSRFQRGWKRQKWCHYFTYGSFMFSICFSMFTFHMILFNNVCFMEFRSKSWQWFDMDNLHMPQGSRKKATFQERFRRRCDVIQCDVMGLICGRGRVFFRDVDVMDHSKSDMKTRAAGWSWNWVVTWGAFHTCFLKSDVFHDFHDFQGISWFHDIWIVWLMIWIQY